MSTHEDARRDAVETVTRYLIDRDRADPADRADAEVDAAIIVQDLGRQGWRPTAALPVPHWQATGQRAAPEDVHRNADAARALLARRTKEAGTDGR